MQPFRKVAFYFVAHADDWQLFMDPEISRDITDKECKVVIVHTTAGDAGMGKKYWKARETAAIESLLFRVSTDAMLQHSEKEVHSAGKTHFLFSLNNCRCYFMRLPDGAFDGAGFHQYGSQSLDKFRTGVVETLTSVDGKSVYHDWNELTQTVDGIIEYELSFLLQDQAAECCLNFPEPEKEINPSDHNDHYNTSLLIRNTKAYTLYKKRAFLSYAIRDSDRLLSGEALFWKVGMFATYHQTVFREYGHSTLSEDPSFIPWCLRDSSFREL